LNKAQQRYKRVIAISLPPTRRHWSTISFSSTLYLYPILDLLLANIPSFLEPEIRLGLQEALVNAAKHGNRLDPQKTVLVEFCISNKGYSWVISDEGQGFSPQRCDCENHLAPHLPPDVSENGRGLCILHQVFDKVYWNSQGTKLHLSKQTKTAKFKLS